MRPALALALGVAVSLALAACGGTSDETAAPQSQPPVLEMDSQDVAREQAPAIAGQSFGGDAIALADFRGKPVLVNVWSSW